MMLLDYLAPIASLAKSEIDVVARHAAPVVAGVADGRRRGLLSRRGLLDRHGQIGWRGLLERRGQIGRSGLLDGRGQIDRRGQLDWPSRSGSVFEIGLKKID
jgi:hypothetical protein